MIVSSIIIWAAAILYGAVFGLANARIFVLLLSKDDTSLEYTSGSGSLIGGVSAVIAGVFFYVIDPIQGSLGEHSTSLFIITSGFTLLVPALLCSCRIIDRILKATKKTVDRFFNRQK